MSEEQRCEMTISHGALAALGHAWDGELSPISVLARTTEEDQTDDAKRALVEGKEELRAAGVIDSDGKVDARYARTTEVLATARSFTHLLLASSIEQVLQLSCFFSPDGDAVSMTDIQGNYSIEHPALIDRLIEAVIERLGISIYKDSDIDLVLPPEQAMVLAAMLDIRRRGLLRALADGKEERATIMDKDAIVTALSNEDVSYQWFANILREMLDVGTEHMHQEIGGALEGLTSSGLITIDGNTISLNDELSHLGRRMLVLDKIVTLLSGRLNEDDAIVHSGLLFIQAGVHDVLMIETVPEGAHIKAVSPTQVIDILTFFFGPGFLEALDKVKET